MNDETKRLTNADLAEIKKRAEAATSGPWEYIESDNVVITNDSDYCYAPEIAEEFSVGDDATFIAHARQDVPALLAEVERLRKVIEYLHECSSEFYTEYDAETDCWSIPDDDSLFDIKQEIFVISHEAVNEDD